MANQEHHCSNCEIETLTLDDGRKAERHVSMDSNGNQVIDVFVEEKRPLKLEKRIIREFKQVVAKETHQIIHNGEVEAVEVKSAETELPIQVHETVKVGKVGVDFSSDFVRKDELQAMVSESVASGLEALMEDYEPVVAQSASPVLSAQSIVEKNVSEKHKDRSVVNMIMVAILVAQAAIVGYVYLVM